MVEVSIKYNGVSISSVEKDDAKYIKQWFMNRNNMMYYGTSDNAQIKEFDEIFLGYYISECEIFLKIAKDNELIGIFKGRIEFKDENIIWISYFALDDIYIDNEEGKSFLEKILEYFARNYGINSFLIGVSDGEKRKLNFFKNNGFYVIRTGGIITSRTSSNIIMKKKI